jgi:hypothetical protein
VDFAFWVLRNPSLASPSQSRDSSIGNELGINRVPALLRRASSPWKFKVVIHPVRQYLIREHKGS